ncbi:N-acetylmannosamine-6-phosphate 2-epimerase [Spiroplasma turonicum]|uniref:Putative N-acetylmannosamine-6-phosphate 2-epimerase n=1 Tax=Spiroplasma turonicum TaxID=216946 RepID=A0A0K1P7U1_9MOLU|nr:N-acetylmannosamine-6-phosphate 2-epimerase [Spiroplasma turonicum]AKU79952.1 N acetylmannosamine 6 phosphate 2 epimerase [Spiroplasma turonicum]ALX70965.1 N-acylglucosamine-6-phosphate 2-epimerase [Spiroplasma turonicum]
MNIGILKNKLIISCQSVEGEPLNDAYIVSKLAYACVLGGAEILRMSQIEHIIEAKKFINVPIIGLVKKKYSDSEVYITPTFQEVKDLIEVAKVDIVAIDATFRKRPNNTNLDDLFKLIKKNWPNQLFMADCSTSEEVIYASKLGFDIVSLTLCGNTMDTIHLKDKKNELNYIKNILTKIDKPFIAEGGIWTPTKVRELLNGGVYAVVVGSAITRPHLITKWWLEKIKES